MDNHPPGMTPAVFAEKVLSPNGEYVQYGAFSPSGGEFFYSVTDKGWSSSQVFVVDSKNPAPVHLFLLNKEWDGEPFLSFSGDKLFFTSILPPQKNKPWQSDFYYIQKTNGGWGTPVKLDPPINSDSSEWHFSQTTNGVVYFASEREGSRLKADLFRSVPENGKYTKVEKLPSPINTEYNDSDPLIAPDESYLIFHSDRPGGFGEHDLYICFRKSDGTWIKPKNMGSAINSKGWEMAPALTPDFKYLLFTRREAFQTDTPSKIYWVDIKFVEQLRRESIGE
jgi:Tol biopolymer transport system component